MQLAKDHSKEQTVLLVTLNIRKSHNEGNTWITDGWTTDDCIVLYLFTFYKSLQKMWN
jgi:hypothetical protein